MSNWFVVQTRARKQDAAKGEITAMGFKAYVPRIARRRLHAGKWRKENVPRFGTYIFAKFDPSVPGWQNLLHGKARFAIRSIICDAEFVPVPVPRKAIVAVRAFRYSIPDPSVPHRYRPGELCLVRWGGRTQQAIFVEYHGDRQYVQTWIFGAARTLEVRTSELETLDSDQGYL